MKKMILLVSIIVFAGCAAVNQIESMSFNEVKVKEPQITASLQRTLSEQKAIFSIAISPRGGLLASGGLGNTITIWDVDSGKILKTLEVPQDVVLSIAFSPDGKVLASSHSDSRIFKIWDVESGRVLKTLRGNTKYMVGGVAFGPDGVTVVGCCERTLRIWDSVSGEELKDLNGHTSWISSIDFSPDGKLLASRGNDNIIIIWDFVAGQELRRFRVGKKDTRIAFSADGRYLASAGGGSSVIRLIDVTTGMNLKYFRGLGHFRSFAFSPDGRWLAGSFNLGLPFSSENIIKLWDVVSGFELLTLRGHSNDVESIAFSPDSRLLASGSLDKTINLWRLEKNSTMVP